MEHIKVESSNLSSYGYDAEAGILEIEFHSGSRWQFPVSMELFAEFEEAPSKGQFFSRRIRCLGGTKVEPQETQSQGLRSA